VIEAAEQGAAFSEARARVRRAIEQVVAAEDAVTLRHEGIDLVTGRAQFVGPRTIEVDGGTTASAGKGVVIATGAGPVVPPIRGLRGTAGGRILGATIVAPRAGEMIHELVLAMGSGMFPARLTVTMHAYPTWSIAIQQAAAQLFGVVRERRARPASLEPDPAEEVRLEVERDAVRFANGETVGRLSGFRH
jgi:pyruvate/2-oxoglutarate dehydrogenase complex dihydrolipoamide dehydrogenase (E3) component